MRLDAIVTGQAYACQLGIGQGHAAVRRCLVIDRDQPGDLVGITVNSETWYVPSRAIAMTWESYEGINDKDRAIIDAERADLAAAQIAGSLAATTTAEQLGTFLGIEQPLKVLRVDGEFMVGIPVRQLRELALA